MAFRRDKALATAERYAARGQHDKAAKEYQAVVEHDPKDIRSWLLLADCLVRSGQPEKAIERYIQVAGFYQQAKDYQKALAVYRQVLNLDTSRLDVQLRCANLMRQLGRMADAVALMERVAQTYLRNGRADDALKIYAEVADVDPSQVARRLRVAELHSRQGNIDEAVEAFGACADFLYDAERFEEYVRVAERLLYHKQDMPEVLRQLAAVYLRLQQPKRALMKLNVLLQSSSSDPGGLELLAQTLQAMGKSDKAVSVMLELAREQKDQGQDGSSTATRVLRQALRWSPGHSEATRMLSEITGSQPQAQVQAEAEQLGAPEEIEEIEELEEIEEIEEIEELDTGVIDLDDEDFDEPTAAADRAGVPQPPRGDNDSLTKEVMNDVTREHVLGDEEVDLDKSFQEARVLVKYRLFDHALGHLEEVISVEPNHLPALGLKAEILLEMERNDESADLHAYVAQLLVGNDPAKAQKHVTAALAAVPGHRDATAIQRRLGGTASEPAGEVETSASAEDPETSFADIDDDAESDEFDDAFGSIELGGDAGTGEDDFAGIEVDDDISEPISLADTEAQPDVAPASAPPAQFDDVALEDADPGLAQALGLGGDVGGTTESAPEPEVGAPTEIPADQDISELPVEDDFDIALHSEVQPLPEEPIEVEDRFGLDGDDDSHGEPAQTSAGSRPAPTEGQAFETMEAEVVDVLEEGDSPLEPEPEPQGAVTETITADDGVVDEAKVVPAAETEPDSWADLTEETEELDFFLSQGLEDDAVAAFEDLSAKHPGHPALAPFAVKLGLAEPPAEAESAPEPEPEPVEAAASVGADDDAMTAAAAAADATAATPMFDFTDDEDDDDFLAAIFDDEGAAERQEKKEVEHKARAEVQGEADAATNYDLGMAYHGMGLVDDAIGAFTKASRDPVWRAKAYIMIGQLHSHTGDNDAAIEAFREAIDSSTNEDETSEAAYELALVYEERGDTAQAIEHLGRVKAGFRDRDEKLQSLGA